MIAVFIIILAVLDLVVLFFMLSYLLRKIASRGWPKTIGIITGTQIGCTLDPTHYDERYSANFTFNYKVPGTEMHGKFIINSFLQTEGFAKRAIAAHPVGTTLELRYNPEEPGEYFTEFDGPGAAFWIYFMCFIFVFIFLLYEIFIPK